MIVLVPPRKCEWEDCDEPATEIAVGEKHKLGCYCEKHADIVSDERRPEYNVSCPNCGCQFGIG